MNIKKILSMDENGRFLMTIWDKVSTEQLLEDSKERYCPPHTFPHTLPILGQKVTDEPCHIHTSSWRQLHHKPFCKRLKCPHYQDMRQAQKVYQDKQP